MWYQDKRPPTLSISSLDDKNILPSPLNYDRDKKSEARSGLLVTWPATIFIIFLTKQ